MNFWAGIFIGVFIGANIGIFVTGLLVASKRSENAENFHLSQYPMDEAVIDDTVPSSSLRSALAFPRSGYVQPNAQDSQYS